MCNSTPTNITVGPSGLMRILVAPSALARAMVGSSALKRITLGSRAPKNYLKMSKYPPAHNSLGDIGLFMAYHTVRKIVSACFKLNSETQNLIP